MFEDFVPKKRITRGFAWA